MARQFDKGHNILVDLDLGARGASKVAQMLTFLARSRIQYAITESPPVSQAILTDFWTDIQYDETVNPPVIRTTVNAQPVAFSASDLRQILQLGTVEQEDGETEYPMDFVEGALGRMGYTGERRGRQFLKALVIGEWRFLWHVIVTVFGPKKGGFDELSPALISAVLSLVYNKPYSFCDYIFGELVRQISGAVRSRFLIYPRFCMMIIRHRIPGLVVPQPHLRVDTIGLRGYNAMFMQTIRREEYVKPEIRDLFGFIIDPQYITPPNHGWQDVAAAAAHQPGAAAAADVVPHPEPQELLEDVLIQAGQQGQLVNPEVVAEVVQDVLGQNDDAHNPLLQEIDQYVAPTEVQL